MSNEGNIRSEFEADSVEFDALTFLQKVLDTIKTMQASAVPQENTLFTSTADITTSNGKLENPINTFLRIIGFPALRDDTQIKKVNDDNKKKVEQQAQANLASDNTSAACEKITFFTEEQLSLYLNQAGTLNYINSGGSADAENIKQYILAIKKREAAASKKPNAEAVVNCMKSPLSILDSTGLNSFSQNQDSHINNQILDVGQLRKPSIFPLVVNADIPVYPTNKRVAPLFYSGDYVDADSGRLSRSFLENIIYMRVGVLQGQTNQEMVDALTANANKILTSLPSDASQDIKNSVSQLSNQISNFKYVELQIADKFIKAITKCSENYRSSVKENEKLRQSIVYPPAPKTEPFEKAGEAKLTEEQRQKLNNDYDLSKLGIKDIDSKIAQLEAEQEKANAALSLLPTEKIKLQNELRKIWEGSTSSNVTEDIFLSEFVELVSFEKNTYEEKIKELKEKKKTEVAKCENIRQAFIVYTGEFYGLSIFDVLCVLFALFTVEEKYLVGLLSQDARKRLLDSNTSFSTLSTNSNKTQKERTLEDIVPESSSVTQLQAVKEVEKLTKSYFLLADALYRAAEKSGENKVSSSG